MLSAKNRCHFFAACPKGDFGDNSNDFPKAIMTVAYRAICSMAPLALGLWGLASVSSAAFAAEKPYATVKGWAVIINTNADGSHNRCIMSLGKGEEMLRLALTPTGWSLSVPGLGSTRPLPGGFGFDGGQTTPIDFSVDTKKGARAWFSISPADVDRMRASSTIEVDIGKYSLQWPLTGSAAAITKVEECAAKFGPKANANNAPSAGAGLMKKRVRSDDTASEPAAAPAVEDDAFRLGAMCPAAGSFRSLQLSDPATATFMNRSDRALTVYWLNFEGNPVEYAATLPGESVTLDTYAAHAWIAKDFDGTCVGGVHVAEAGANRFVLE
jgi:hypothetical protein